MSSFHRRLCFSVSQFINNSILAKMKLFFLAEILAPNDFCYLSFQAMGKRKLQKYSYEYLKLGKINSPDMLQFHLVPTGKMMPIHLSKELLGWRLLVLVSC